MEKRRERKGVPEGAFWGSLSSPYAEREMARMYGFTPHPANPVLLLEAFPGRVPKPTQETGDLR